MIVQSKDNNNLSLSDLISKVNVRRRRGTKNGKKSKAKMIEGTKNQNFFNQENQEIAFLQPKIYLENGNAIVKPVITFKEDVITKENS